MHDAVTAERHGVPAIGVMTERFASAAALMARVLGMPSYKFVTIGHPISNASDAQIEAYARATIDQARDLLLQGSL